MKHTMGWLRDLPDRNDYTISSKKVKPFLLKCTAFGDEDGKELPDKYDIGEHVELPRIETQKIGDCTAHSGTYAYETYIKFLEQEDPTHIKFSDLSRLFLYKTTRNLLGWKGDTGAYLRTTMKAMAKHGVLPEEFYKYDVSKFDREPPASIYDIAKDFQALIYYRLDKHLWSPEKIINSIKLNICSNRTCMFGFTIYSNMGNSGNVALPRKGDRERGGHAIVAIGFDNKYKIAKSIGAFKCANSWGKKWGKGGFLWLPYDYIRKGLAVDWWALNSAEWKNASCFK